jgi:hypothetical protein
MINEEATIRTCSHYTGRLLLLVVAVAALLAATSPAPSARAAVLASWQAWEISVDFPNQQPQVVYTAYIGTNDPNPRILDSIAIDISADCVVQGGPLTYDQDGYAIFDGATYIECTAPSWRDQLAILGPYLPGASKNTLSCDAGNGPLFVAADVKLDSVSASNPIIDAHDLGLTFSLPSSVANARTVIALTSGAYASPLWPVNGAGKRMLMGENGPAIVEAAAYFGWLGFLTDPSWQGFFKTTVVGPKIGHWIESPSASWTTPAGPYKLKTQGAVVYIGHNGLTGANLRGRLSSGRIDPGCKTS